MSDLLQSTLGTRKRYQQTPYFRGGMRRFYGAFSAMFSNRQGQMPISRQMSAQSLSEPQRARAHVLGRAVRPPQPVGGSLGKLGGRGYIKARLCVPPHSAPRLTNDRQSPKMTQGVVT